MAKELFGGCRGAAAPAGPGGAPQQWDAREKASCLLLFAVVVVVVGSKIIYLLSEQGFYFGVFRQIYDWTVLYL